VLDAVPTFHTVGAALRRVLPKGRDLLRALLWLGLLFAGAAVALFGGRITDDPANRDARRIAKQAPGFATAAGVGYYANSANDVASALVLLFELLVVNNWFVLVSGYVAVTSTASRLFFVAWYLVGVLTLLNVVVAATLDSFVAEFNDARSGGVVTESSLRRVRRASTLTIDAARVTGTATGLSGAFSVAVAADADAASPEDRRNLVHRLFDDARTVERRDPGRRRDEDPPM